MHSIGPLSPGNPRESEGIRLPHIAGCALLRWLVTIVLAAVSAAILDMSIIAG